MQRTSAFCAALALAVTLFAAACDGSPSAPAAAVDEEISFTTGAPLPAVPGFAAQSDPVYRSPRLGAQLTWQDVEGEDVYLIQWRVGETGAWKTLVTTGANRTHFETDSVRDGGQRNYYRIAAMTSAFQAGPFTTLLLKPGVRTQDTELLNDSVARVKVDFGNYGPPATYSVQYAADFTMAGAVLSPGVTRSETFGSALVSIPVTPGVRYWYRAVGVGEGGTSYGEIRSFFNGPPAAPSGAQAVFHQDRLALQGGQLLPGYRVQVDWAHGGEQVSRFLVQRRTLGQTAWAQVADLGPSARQYVDISLPVAPAGAYEYRVLACAEVARCMPSGPLQATTTAMPAPTSFLAVQQPDGAVWLRWQDLVGEEWYIIQWRADSTAGWNTILSSGPGASPWNYTTSAVAAGVVNHYRIAGVGVGWRLGPWASFSMLASSRGLRMVAKTAAPTGVTSTSATLNGTVTPNGQSTTAWFEWSTDPALGTYTSTPAQALGAGTAAVPVSFVLSQPAGQAYYYRLAAANAGGTVRGSTVGVHVQVGPPAAAALSAAYSTTTFQVNVSWTHSGAGTPTRHRLYRRAVGATSWTLLQDDVASLRTYTDTQFPLNEARTYDYYVASCNDANECTASTQQRVTTGPMPAPSGLTSWRTLTGFVMLQWQDLAGDQVYVVQWRTPSTDWQTLATIDKNESSSVHPLVTPGTHYFRVAGQALDNRIGQFAETTVVVP